MDDRQATPNATELEGQTLRTPSGTDAGPVRQSDSLPSFSVAEIANILGISTDAVRARIHRGTLEAVKIEGVWSVRLPEDAQISDIPLDSSGISPNATADPSATSQASTANAPDPRQDVLVDHLQSEVTYLRERLEEAERERERMLQQMANERERFDVIHRTALGRIEALTATVSERPEQQDATGEHAEDVASQESTSTSMQGVRAWLRRLLGG